MNIKHKLIRLSILTGWLGAVLATRAADPTYWSWAPVPPMGWNSWDGFATTVTEAQTRAQADFMAQHLQRYGWQYIVVDIQWYEPNATGFDYHQGAKLEIDNYGRLLPAPNKFPSAAEGHGFKPLADYLHSLGLKFGVHLMRGIPRQAVADKTPVKGTHYTAADIADTNSVCPWNTDMYGVDMTRPGAQAYYNSVFDQFAEWGLDFIKVDDLSRPYHTAEIEAIRKAIDRTGRPIVFSTSPGATPLSAGDNVMTNANMWRISDDFWDNWKLLYAQFARARDWTPYRDAGHWPDADMLPIGILQMGKSHTHFTRDEQITLMSLWSIARSPLMIGADLTKLDNFTLSLLTNDEVIAVNQNSTQNHQLFQRDGFCAWVADVPSSPDKYLALFNTRALPGRLSPELAAFRSPPVSSHAPKTKVKFDIAVNGATKLFLVMEDDRGDEGGSDAAWSEPTLETTNGSVRLTDLKWTSATSGSGRVSTETSASGKALLLAGKPVTFGIGAHPDSVIEYDLPNGVTRFHGTAGLDGSRINPSGWSDADVRFLIFTQSPYATEAAAAVPVKWSDLGFDGHGIVRDLWRQTDLRTFTNGFAPLIPAHGAGLYRVSAVKLSGQIHAAGMAQAWQPNK